MAGGMVARGLQGGLASRGEGLMDDLPPHGQPVEDSDTSRYNNPASKIRATDSPSVLA